MELGQPHVKFISKIRVNNRITHHLIEIILSSGRFMICGHTPTYWIGMGGCYGWVGQWVGSCQMD